MKYMIALFAVIVAFGCSSTPRMDVSQVGGNADEANVVYNSSIVQKRITIESVNTEVMANGLYKVQAVVRSKYRETQNIQYKYEWLNDEGMMIATTPWKPTVVYGQATANLSAVSQSSAAKNYRLLIAENK